MKYFNIDNLCWLDVFSMNDYSYNSPEMEKLSPEPRKNHIAELLGSQILIHGGINESNEILNDCFVLTLSSLKLNICTKDKNTPAPKLYGHSSCVVIPHFILFHRKFSIYSYPNLELVKLNN